jgi:hypothetical protein
MMKNITLKLKHLVLFTTLAMFSVAASAVNVTYSLTTHVDGRTITGTANVAAGGDLLNAMPQALWRAYCTYTFTNNAGEQITTAPANGGTVYVDYVFDPPFILSEEGKDPVYNYLRTYNYSGSNNYLVIYDQSAENEWGTYKETIMSWKSVNGATPKAGRNYPIAKAGHDQWAFYGDAYDFQIRLNDASIDNNYLIWRSTTRNETPMGLGAKPEVGWQLYVNTAENDKMSGTMAMGPYGVTNYLASLENVNSCVWTDKLTTSEQYFDSHNQLVYKPGGTSQTTMNKNNLWWYAFFATPATSPANSTDIWHVTYKIQKVDGSWYDDIVVQKNSNNLTPSFPPAGFNPNPDYEYDYFYLDANFKEKCADNYTMPAEGNTILYIKEIEEAKYISTPWMTLVLPYSIDDLTAFFGEDAVQVQEYTSVAGELTEAASESYFTCHLNFTATDKIEAYMPYLFRAVHARQSDLDRMYDILGIEAINEPIEVKLYDNTHAPEIGVSMKGNLAANGYEMPGDGLNFYFGSSQDATGAYAYNFYRRAATIPQFRCYFFVTDERTGGANPIKVRFGSDSLNGISTVAADTNVNAPIYSLDGRKVDASSLSNLQKGIYIVNGRKVVK